MFFDIKTDRINPQGFIVLVIFSLLLHVCHTCMQNIKIKTFGGVPVPGVAVSRALVEPISAILAAAQAI